MHALSLTTPHTESKVVDQNYPKGGRVSEKVVCRICGVGRRRLGAHIKATHDLSVEDYKSKFPGALVEVPGTRKRSSATRAKQAAAARRRWADPAERAAQSDRLKEAAPWAGKSLSDEHKQAISDGGSGVSHNLTDERRQEIGEQGRHVLAEIRQCPGYRDRLSEGQKRRHQKGVYGLADPAVWLKAHESKVRNGNLQVPGQGRGISGFRKGIPHYCRSTLEANFARILSHEGVPYEYEPKVFMLPDGGRWTPDFRLLAPLGDIPAGWVELKGWRKKDGTLPGGASDKIKAFKKLTGESVYVLVENSPEWEVLQSKYQGFVAWERPRYNLKTHPQVFGRS